MRIKGKRFRDALQRARVRHQWGEPFGAVRQQLQRRRRFVSGAAHIEYVGKEGMVNRATVTNPVIGGNYVWKLIQDATGGITATLGSGCTWLVANGGTPSGAHVITLTNAPNAVDVLAFVYDGTNCLASVIYNLKP